MSLKHLMRKLCSRNPTLSLAFVILSTGLILMYTFPQTMDDIPPLIDLKYKAGKHVVERIQPGIFEPAHELEKEEDDDYFYDRKRILIKHLPAPFHHKKPDHTYRNLLSVEPPAFLPNFKTPCWVEELESSKPYDTPIFYHKNVRLPRARKTMEGIYSTRMQNGSHWRLRCLPYFYIGGIQKCGTSELYIKLAMHPNITRGPVKEPHFWTRMRAGYSHNGFHSIGSYIDLYDAAAEEIRQKVSPSQEHMGAKAYHPMIFGEGSVSTMCENDYWFNLPENRDQKSPKHSIAEYIYHITPQARFIMAVRNPADRLFSDYLHLYKTPQTKTARIFHELVESSVTLMNVCLDHKTPLECVSDIKMAHESKLHIRQGFYIVFLTEWLKVFPLNQVYVVRLEDIKINRIKTLNEVCKFLEAGPFPPNVAAEIETLLPRNANNNTNEPMWQKTRNILNRLYQPFNEQLADFLKDKKYLWL